MKHATKLGKSRNDQRGCAPPPPLPPPPDGCDEEEDELDEPEEPPEPRLPSQAPPPEEPELDREEPPPEVCAGGGVIAGRAGREARGTAGFEGAFVGCVTFALSGKAFPIIPVGVLVPFEGIARFGGLFAFTKRCSCGS